MSARARRRVLTALGLALLLPFAAEACLALGLGYGNPRRLVADRELGWRLAPGQVCEGVPGVAEFIDSRGWRDREWRPTEHDAPLVFVAGDTAAYGQGVPVEATWPRVLERELRRAHPRALVRRLATPGYALEQQLAAVARESRIAAPDVVVLELGPTSIRPMRVLHEPERFPLQGIAQTSALWDWVRRTWLVRPRGEAWDEERRALADPDDPANAPLWAAARERLAVLQSELAVRGARLVLVEAAPREGARGSLRWRELARELGATWVSPAESLHGLDVDAAGHAAIGRVAADALVRELPPTELQPVARSTAGDPIALSLAPGGARAWRVDGARASELRLAGAGFERLRGFDIEGPVFGLLESEDCLFLAAGERGLLFADLSDAEPLVRTLWREPGRWCTDLDARDGHLWSTFAALDASRLLAFDARTLALEQSFELPPGTAWAVAARGQRAWVALGAGGLARADLVSGEVQAGPDPGAGPWDVVRDVALAPEHLAAACDGLGVAFVALDALWSSATPCELVALALDRRPTYAARVSADGARVAVGTNLAPVAAQEGAPFGLAGWLDERLRVGGIDESEFPTGTAQGWFLLEQSGGAWRETARASGIGGWRSLVLAGDRSWEQHIGAGLVVRRAGDGAVLAGDRPEGLSVIGAELALDDPDLLLPANDPAGALAGGWLRISGARAEVSADTRGLEPMGLLPGPQWRDAQGRTWCLAGTPVGWNLWLVDAAEPRASRRWSVSAPLDADGARGGAYFSAVLQGDLLLGTRARSREGLLIASARELVERALASGADTALELPARASLRTHAQAGVREAFTWEPALDAGRGLALVPCGVDGNDRARWLVVDVAATPPRVLSQIAGELARGHAVGAAFDGTRAVALDLLGDVLVVDLADPSAPRRLGRWSAPPDGFDGRAPNLLGLAIDARHVWIAAGRAGLVQLELDARGELAFERRLPTDGWAASVRPAVGGRLVVGDQKAGVRVYAP